MKERDLIALTDLLPNELSEVLELKPFQGRQLFRWLHQKAVYEFDAMTDLSKELRERIKGAAIAGQLEWATEAVSRQPGAAAGTTKALFRLHDGDTIESVVLHDEERVTLCVSSQAGCQLKCAFCATGQSGFRRDLTAGEIAEQASRLVAREALGERTPNVVYMGMGEPFQNYDAVVRSIRLIMQKDGLNIGARKITVSTVGHVPGIRRFAEEDWQVRLAISLHAANDHLRSELVPMNRRYPLSELMAAVNHYCSATARQVSFEWTLLRGINDSQEAACELARLIADLPAVVNVIPYNPVEGTGFQAPARGTIDQFCRTLVSLGVRALPRLERGQDINAACGQLRLQNRM